MCANSPHPKEHPSFGTAKGVDHMKKCIVKMPRKIMLRSGLSLTLVLFNTVGIHALEEGAEEPESFPAAETVNLENPSEIPAEAVISEEPEPSTEPAPEEIQTIIPEELPETVSETAVEEPEAAPENLLEAAEEEPETIPEETPAKEPAVDMDEEPLSATADTDVPELNTEDIPVQRAAVSVFAAPAAAGQETPQTDTENTDNTIENTGTVTIDINGTQFSPDDDESSHWSNGTGWKNVAGQYVAMVDYDDGGTISADGGVLTLAVAGVNRIGSLSGDCSVQIVGTGIVLIDRIDITEGNTVTLHPNTALYDEGSAAVFLLQDDGSYLLINGSATTGILDETYNLDNVRLRVPEGSSLTLGAAAVRTESWEESGQPKEDVTVYTESVPFDYLDPAHDGMVEVKGASASVILGKNSTLTVDSGASIVLESIQIGISTECAELIVQGILDIKGIVEGGLVNIGSGGSVTGDGTLQSTEVSLNPQGSITTDVLLDNSRLRINGDGMTVTPPQLKDSIIYLDGQSITIPRLNASGTSYVGVNTLDEGGYNCSIGDIILDSGSTLNVVCNNHEYVPYTTGKLPRYVEDCILTISGTIAGGTVNVYAGLVEYTGSQTDNLPLAPIDSAARVYFTAVDTESTESPLNMSAEDAAALAQTDTIPMMTFVVVDTLVSNEFLSRKWIIEGATALEPIERKTDQSYTCASFLEECGITGTTITPGHLSEEARYFTAVEIIDRYLNRQRYFMDDRTPFDLNDVIMVRVLECIGRGGQGGSSSTHSETNFTGNGELGGTGAGSTQTGDGKVIFGTNTIPEEPVDPEPDEPTDPEPDENKPGTDTTHSGSTAAVVNTTPVAANETAWTEPAKTTYTYTVPTTPAPAYIPETPAGIAYTVYFETYGGTEILSQIVNAGTTAVKPDDPAKEGFLFDGWYKDKELTEAFDFRTPISADTTLYARWTEPAETVPAPAEPVKKSVSWLWFLLALILGALGYGGWKLSRNTDEE